MQNIEKSYNFDKLNVKQYTVSKGYHNICNTHYLLYKTVYYNTALDMKVGSHIHICIDYKEQEQSLDSIAR